MWRVTLLPRRSNLALLKDAQQLHLESLAGTSRFRSRNIGTGVGLLELPGW